MLERRTFRSRTYDKIRSVNDTFVNRMSVP